MRRSIVSIFVSAVAVSAVISTTACSGGDVAVGKTGQSEQELKRRADGTATGNGQTCSWEGTSGYDYAVSNTSSAQPAPGGPYVIGTSFKSIDGCNDCSCSAQGIMCTMRACDPGQTSPGNPGGGTDPGPRACSAEAKVCPDGSGVGRTGPNCEFAPCPTTNACTKDAKVCPDGSSVGRTGPNCSFAPCPGGTGGCTEEAKICPDGSGVSRTGPNCEFAPCPGEGTACTADAKRCPDGSYVSRTGPNCTFAACP